MPSFHISLPALRANARILHEVAESAGCWVVLALKGFSSWPAFDSISDELDGCCASGIWEAELARKHFGGHILTYSPAYAEDELTALLEFTGHLDFNSVTQWEKFRDQVKSHPRFLSGELKCGLRVNPLCSTGHTPLYDPCVPGSRLGIPPEQLKGVDLSGISGIHFHTLCEQNSDDLEKTVLAVEEHFGWLLERPEITWLNMGGGHWITKPSYDRERLVRVVRRIRETYGVEVWLEPGEAVAIHTGVLRCRVLDVFESCGFNMAILDVSASAHMPDVLEMPYRPDVFLVEKKTESTMNGDAGLPAVVLPGEVYLSAGESGEKACTYRLGASTCLAGDVMGDYSFDRPLVPGDELVFDDMSHYTMVKTSFFNGVRHPDICLVDEDGHVEVVRRFSQADFESRLG